MIRYLITLLAYASCIRHANKIFADGLGSEDEERLVRDIFRGYNKLIRPVANMSEVVHVQFGMALIQLISVDEKNQILKSNVWLRLAWHDYQLVWSPTEYGGIEKVTLSSHIIWNPEPVLMNKCGIFKKPHR